MNHAFQKSFFSFRCGPSWLYFFNLKPLKGSSSWELEVVANTWSANHVQRLELNRKNHNDIYTSSDATTEWRGRSRRFNKKHSCDACVQLKTDLKRIEIKRLRFGCSLKAGPVPPGDSAFFRRRCLAGFRRTPLN